MCFYDIRGNSGRPLCRSTFENPPIEVVALMGHSSKKMVYEVYGKFAKGLENERGQIKAYLGI